MIDEQLEHAERAHHRAYLATVRRDEQAAADARAERDHHLRLACQHDPTMQHNAWYECRPELAAIAKTLR